MALTKVTGQVIKNTTDVTVGVLTVTNTLAVGGTVSIGGTLTYEDVTNVDAVGLITARNGIVVGSGITLSKDGDGFFTGIVTATTFSGSLASSNLTGALPAIDGANLTGVLSNIVEDTSPQLGANLDVNGANIVFPDSSSAGTNLNRLKFGTGTDLHIWHNGSTGNSNISAYSGDLYIQGNNGSGTGVNQIAVKSNAAVELNYQGTKKFETASYGVSTDDLMNFNGSGDKILIADDGKISFGGGGDLDIYHSGGTNYCDIASSQQLYFRVGGSNKFYVQSGGAQFVGSLYADDSNKIELGNGQDLKIYHDGTDSRIENTTGKLYLKDDYITFVRQADDTVSFQVYEGGSTDLYYNHTLRFQTVSDGASTNGLQRFANDSGAVGGFTHCLTSGTISNGGTFTAQTYNCHAGGLVTITTNRRPSGSNNKNISVFPIVINSTSNASLGSALSSMSGSSGSSFSVTGTSRGVIVTNTSGLDQKVSVRFDITGI